MGFPAVGEAAEVAATAAEPASAAPSLQGSRTAAKSQERAPRPAPQPAETGAPPADAVKQEGDADNEPLEDAAWDVLRRRRLMPGAATSAKDFENHFATLASMNDIFQAIPPEPIDTSSTIVDKVRAWTTWVQHRFANVSDYMTRLCVAVLALGGLRQVDIHLREHALIYWIAQGRRSLRFHAGDCYMRTPSGAFQQHRGVPPNHDRVQVFLLHVEGSFRSTLKATARTPERLLSAVRAQYESAADEQAFLNSCVNACLDAGADPARRGGVRFGDDGADGDAGDPAASWNIAAAKTVQAVKKLLTREIAEDKLLHYMCKWCDSSKLYEDCAVRYDAGPIPAEQVSRDRLANCYLRVPHCLKGTVPVDITARLQKFYSQTFWGNAAAFKCGQAAQALAKRGLNVVRLFIGLSAGGVGQSLYSAHLQAMYGHNFAYFDPNIWHNEEHIQSTPWTVKNDLAGRPIQDLRACQKGH